MPVKPAMTTPVMPGTHQTVIPDLIEHLKRHPAMRQDACDVVEEGTKLMVLVSLLSLDF